MRTERGRVAVTLTALATAMLVTFSGCAGLSQTADEAGPQRQPLWNTDTDARLLHVLGDPRAAGTDAWPGRFDAPVAIGDLDGDGVDEVVVPSRDRHVYVFQADGSMVAKLPSKYPPSWHIERVLNQPQIAVMRPGEAPSIVTTNAAATVESWRLVDAATWQFEKTIETRVDTCNRSPGMDGGPVVADLDSDEEMEIVVQTEEVGLYAVETDGTILWQQCWAGGNSAPAVDDLDGDGDLEAVFASDGGFVAVLDGATGKPHWTFDAGTVPIPANITLVTGNMSRSLVAGDVPELLDPTGRMELADLDLGYIDPASVVVAPTIAELDGKAPKEVLFTARHAPFDDPDRYGEFHMAIFAVHQNLTTWQPELLWMRQPDWAHPMSNTRLVVDDVDGDGEADIFGMDWNTIGHRPGDWSVLGPAHVFRLNSTGHDVWVHDVEAWWSNMDIALADADGDGIKEVLANGPRGGQDGIWRIDAGTGKAEGSLIADGWKMTRGPQVADLDHDGTMELIFSAERVDDPTDGVVLRYTLGVPGSGT